MTTLREHENKNGVSHKPPRVVELPPSAWSSTAKERPTTPVKIGLRLVSEDDRHQARETAIDAVGLEVTEVSDRNDIFNSVLIRELVACGCCLALDERQPFFLSGGLEVAQRLTTDGVKRLWQELETLDIANRVAMPEANDEGFSHLVAMWDRGAAFEYMPPEVAASLRRTVEYVRQEMADAEGRAEAMGVILAAG